MALLEVMGDKSHERGWPGNVNILEATIKAVLGAVYVDDSGASAFFREGSLRVFNLILKASELIDARE